MAMNRNELGATVRRICLDALEGKLRLEDLKDRWPSGANEDGFLSKVHDDIEDGVEHTLGFFLKKGIDRAAWQRSDMYLTLLIDVELLILDADSNALNACREQLLKSKDIAQGTISERITKWFASSR